MTRDHLTPTTLLVWLLAVAAAATIVAPRAAGAEPLLAPSISTLPAPVLPPPDPFGTDSFPAGPALEMPLPPVVAPPFVGDATAPNYFIVSARRSAQSPWERGGCPLEVYHRLPDESLHPSDVGSLASQLIPGVPVCIFVHGSFVDWEGHCRESRHSYRWIRNAAAGQPIHVIFYTWPSEGHYPLVTPLGVAALGRQAAFNGFHVASLLSQLPSENPVCLVGHSHGARVTASALHLAAGGAVAGHVLATGPLPRRRLRAVVTAAAIDHDWLNPGERYGLAVHSVEGLLNVRNRADLVLGVYPLLNPLHLRALGRSGFTRYDRRRLGPLNARLCEIEVAPLIGVGHVWPHYFQSPEIAAALVPYVYFTDPALPVEWAPPTSMPVESSRGGPLRARVQRSDIRPFSGGFLGVGLR